MTPVVLTIAGSDPSGGAGIQADLRTFAAVGVVGVSAITALTVQNSLGVESVHPIPADILTAQLEAIFSDVKVAAVKIGMLGGAEQVRAAAAALRKYAPPNVVLDPVLASTGGVPLLDAAGVQVLLSELMPLCDLVTPNIKEAFQLTGLPVSDKDSMCRAGENLISLGAKAALVKGGHLDGEPLDFLVYAEDDMVLLHDMPGERVNTVHTHGTGCALSAAVAAGLAKGEHIASAVMEAKFRLFYALQSPIVVGSGRGYPDMTGTLAKYHDVEYAKKLTLIRGVYVVTDRDIFPNRTHRDILRAAYAAGVTVAQLREKSLSLPVLIRAAKMLQFERTLTKQLLIVNDSVDVALAAQTDGVHLGPADMPPRYAREIMGPHQIIGVSVATLKEAQASAPYASYFGVGAIFGSQTKKDAGEAIGLGRIREIKDAFPQIPIVAIGGITLDNITQVAAAGADAAAVVSAVVAAPDMAEAVRELARRFESGKAKV